jgi:hypothetical protein
VFSPRVLTGRSHHSYPRWDSGTSPGAIWIARIHGHHIDHRYRCREHRSRRGSSPRVGVKAATAAGSTPVPIPNTEVKPACVPASTGVGDPLGKLPRFGEGLSASPGMQSVVYAGFVPVEPETVPLQRLVTGSSPPAIHSVHHPRTVATPCGGFCMCPGTFPPDPWSLEGHRYRRPPGTRRRTCFDFIPVGPVRCVRSPHWSPP